MTLKREAIVASARSWIGTPYIHQASLKGIGCDCLGLLRGIWRECVGPEPEALLPYTSDWAEAGGLETLADAGNRHFDPIPVQEADAGDIVLFRWRNNVPAKHIGLLTGKGTMIHAHDGEAVCEVPLAGWWRRRIAFAFRFRGLTCPIQTEV